MRRLLLSLPAITLLACGGGGGPGDGAPATDTLATDGCDPLVPSHCGFPFPSDVFLVDDARTATGKRVQFGPRTLPPHAHEPTDPGAWSDCDGFSPGMSALAHLPGATIAGLPDEDHLALSKSRDSPTILLDTRTGALVPHIAELDMTSVLDEERTFIIRPMARLDDRARYVVAIRHVVDKDGKPLPPSPAFAALRDGTDFPDASIDRRRARYADIFEQLKRAGIDRSDLQLAWDYTTASRESMTRWMIAMRDDALRLVGDAGPEYQIDSMEENPNPDIRRRIHGRMKVPLYLDKAEPTGRMVFGDDGLPTQNGWAWFPFLIHVPNSATRTPAPILQSGHGLFGNKEEGQNGFLATLANQKNYVVIAIDLFGFAHGDSTPVINSITGDLGTFRGVVERQTQGMVNQLLAMRMMKGRFWKDASVQFDGKSAIDPSQCYYRGDSQGGIMGATYMAISTDVTRGLLGEPGMPYDLLLSRSEDFDPYFTIVRLITETFFDVQIAMGAVQMFWDRTEPDGYAPYINANLLPNTPKHEILIHVAIGDHQVTPLGAHILARAVGAKNVRPVNRALFGIPEADAPISGSAIQEFDFGLPKAPTTNTPMRMGDDPHDEVRKLQAARDQTDTFFRTGTVRAYCAGACDPE